MRRFALVVVAAIAITLTLVLALPAGAGATTIWQCKVPEDGGTVTVDFVTAADAAGKNGIPTANDHAGQTFNKRFGEECSVVSG